MTPCAPTDAARYRFWVDEHVRFADLDALGHVNNNAFGVFFEHGRVEFLRQLGGFGQNVPWTVVLARSTIDYRAELHYPAAIRIGLGVLRLGNTSLTLGAAVFRDAVCVAAQEAVGVIVDAVTHRPTPVPADLRAAMEPYHLT